jgi:hypothetical protein
MAEEFVALTVQPEEAAIIVPRNQAQEVYEKYTQLTLEHPLDLALFRALVVGLAITPKAKLAYSQGEQPFAERKIEEWRSRQEEWRQ